MSEMTKHVPTRPFSRSTVALAGALWTAALALTGCGQPQAYGDANSLIVIATNDFWAAVEDSTYAILEPTIFTTRDEKMFYVQQIDPGSSAFTDLRNFRQVIVSGTEDDSLIMKVTAQANRAEESNLNQQVTVFQAEDVWSRGQTVTAVLLEPDDPEGSWLAQLPLVLAMVDSDYQQWTRVRMFVSSPDTALARELGDRFGFSMLVPQVYDNVVRPGLGDGDSIVVLRNDNPDPSVLIRSILVNWSDPADSLTAEAAIEWRAAIDSVHYNVAQAIDISRSSVTEFLLGDQLALEVTGIWSDEEGDFPAGGPFIVWMVQCPGRTYYIDAYLYAPNEDKYEYMLQLQEILNSFSCTVGAPPAAAGS